VWIKKSSLEIPFSQICDSDEFLSFFLEINKNIESFSKIYNNKLDEYRKLFKVEPPHFLVVSCTLYLNFKSYPGTSDSKIFALKKKIRDLEFNPERYINELSLTKKERNQIGELAEKKN